MLSLEDAQDALRARIVPACDTEEAPLDQAHGRFVARALAARVDNPAFDNSAMDGYCFAIADLIANDFALPLAGESRCGDAPGTLASGTAMRIFTGAPLPAGANTVEIQENIKVEDGHIRVPHSISPGANIRKRGEDFRTGDALIDAGRRLRVYDLALAAAAGHATVPVYRRPRALVAATGDELVAPGTPLKPGRIYESNRLSTLTLLRDLGVDAHDGGTVRDDVQALRALIDSARDFDFIITSGGASVGDHDLVRQVFAEFGEIHFWKVKIKPGKPIAFGLIGNNAHFFALPGNPVSSLVTFKLFVEPAIHAWHHAAWQLPQWPAVAASDFRRHPGRTEFLRGRVEPREGVLRAEVLRGQGSHQLRALASTNALIRVEADSDGFRVGDAVRIVPLDCPPQQWK
jgi:molybdopterin molybdotransferase